MGQIEILGADGSIICIPLTSEQTEALKANFSSYRKDLKYPLPLAAHFSYRDDEDVRLRNAADMASIGDING